MPGRRLSHSTIWQTPRKLARHAADLAAHCAGALAAFVNGQPDSAVANILALNCRNGEFAFLVLRALVEVLPSRLDSFVFIVSDPCRDQVARCQAYFERRNFSHFKNLEFSVFDPEYDSECRFLSGRRFKPGPTSAIAESLLLDSLGFDVFSMRDGKLHEGLVQIDSCRQWEPDLQDEIFIERSRLKTNFKPVDLSRKPYYTGEHQPLNRLLEQCETDGNENFCIPVGAVNVLLNVLNMSRGNLVVIAIDNCPKFFQFSSETLRRSLSPVISVLGGSLFTTGSSPNSALICFGKNPSNTVSAFSRIVGDGSIPDLQGFRMNGNLSTALWLLEHSHFDPEVFASLEGRLHYSDASIYLKERLHDALLNVFDRRFATSIGHCSAIGRLLMNMQFWEQACTVWQSIIAESPIDSSIAFYHLAVCYKNLERLEDAKRTIEKSLEQHPFNENFRQLKLELMMAK